MLHVFAIKDSKAGAFKPPSFHPSPGEAERFYRDLTNDKETILARHTSDFSLWSLGKFNQDIGAFELHKEPLHVLNLTDLLTRSTAGVESPGH